MVHENRKKQLILEALLKPLLISISIILLLFTEVNGDVQPVVLRLEGRATATQRDEKTPISLKTGDKIEAGSRIETEINSRMVIDYDQYHHIRLDERTILVFEHSPDKNSKRNERAILAVAGEAWVGIPGDELPKHRISILTTHAAIQPSQAIFRLSVSPSNSVLVKAYEGTVTVRRLKNATQKGKERRKLKPWSHILKPMQQIHIRPDGTSTNPFRFMTKPDRNTWVLWNQSLDNERLSSRQ